MRSSLLIIVLTAAFGLSCSPNQRIVESSANSEPPADSAKDVEPRVQSIDADIAAMRTADFYFIYVFRRKDGAVMDAEDRAFINQNTPYEINRKKLADGDKAVVIGSNYRYPADNFKALKDRFAFEDLSKPESEIPAASPQAK